MCVLMCTPLMLLPHCVGTSFIHRDWDSESDREGVGPNRRGSRNGSRRGGYNGRSESELLLLDPKRVKRILANRQSAARSKVCQLAGMDMGAGQRTADGGTPHRGPAFRGQALQYSA